MLLGAKGLEKLKEQLKDNQFHSGRGAKKLAGTKIVFYMRSGGKARLFFQYSETDRKIIRIIDESDKDSELKVIQNLNKNFN
jgi:hypothetical protein